MSGVFRKRSSVQAEKRRKNKFLVILTVVLFSLELSGCRNDFDASAYTAAILNFQFQGETQDVRTVIEDADFSELSESYQQFINEFVEEYITAGMQLGEMRTEQFAEFASSMFTSMRYEVGKAKKTGKHEYEVPVVIQPNDTFIRYEELLEEDAVQITEKIENGEYKGTDEEIQNQVFREIANNAYDLLLTAYESSEYGEEKTVILRVSQTEEGTYSIDEEDMDNLIVKILRLDEIGG